MTKEEFLEFCEEHAKKNGFNVNPNKKVVDNIINRLLENEKKHSEKYCPCRAITGDKEEDKKIICPCIYHKDEVKNQGHCLCNLFVKNN